MGMTKAAITPLSSLLVPFFNALDEEGLPYCVCGNYEQLPAVTSKDVDIWVKKVDTAEALLSNIARQEGFNVHLINKRGEASGIFLHKVMGDGTTAFVHIDLMPRCAWLSVLPLVPARYIEKNRRRFKSFYIPDPPVEAAMQLLSPLIRGGKIKDKYREHIFTWRHHPTFVSILNRAVGSKQAEHLIKQIETKDWEAIVRNVRKFRLSVIRRSVFTNLNAGGISAFLKAVKWYMLRLIRHRGVLVVFLGPDGVGKSTLCEQILVILQEAFVPGRAKKFYWRPMLLPPIAQLLSILGIKSSNEDFPTTEQGTPPPDNFIISAMRFIYYWLDFAIGQVRFCSAWSRGGIVCFDRYYHDFIACPQRFRFSLPSWVPRMFVHLVPKPDLIFYLHAPPEELVSRKQDIFSPNELELQLHSYSSLLSSFRNVYKIDASKPLDEVTRNVSSIILNFMTQRENKL